MVERMKLETENRKKVYDYFLDVYHAATGSRFVWKQGEKGRVKKIFTTISEAMGKRDEEDFTLVLKCYKEYLLFSAEKWLAWDKRDRLNYIGFLFNKDNINIYVVGRDKKNSKALNIVGTRGKNEWEF
jgi:hypothetical protein